MISLNSISTWSQVWLQVQVTPEVIHALYTRILQVCVCTGNHAIYVLLRQLRCSRGEPPIRIIALTEELIEWAQQAFNTRGVKLCLNSSWDGWRMPFHFGISVWTSFSNSSVLIITHGHSHPEDLLLTIPSWGLPGWSLHGFLPTVQRHAQYIWWVPGFHSDVLVCIHWSWNQSQNNGVKQEWVFGI